jgi:D-glycero-alpha-D-manno-heptose 1-phosphate guanylyltransferase
LSKLANGGIYMMRRDALIDLPWQPGEKLSLEDDLFPHVGQSKHQIAGLVSEGDFIDIGVPDDYQRAATLLI